MHIKTALSPLQHQEDGVPLGSLEESTAKHTFEFRWGHSINLHLLAKSASQHNNINDKTEQTKQQQIPN